MERLLSWVQDIIPKKNKKPEQKPKSLCATKALFNRFSKMAFLQRFFPTCFSCLLISSKGFDLANFLFRNS